MAGTEPTGQQPPAEDDQTTDAAAQPQQPQQPDTPGPDDDGGIKPDSVYSG